MCPIIPRVSEYVIVKVILVHSFTTGMEWLQLKTLMKSPNFVRNQKSKFSVGKGFHGNAMHNWEIF